MNEIENKKYWIWFSLIKGLGSKRKQELLKIFKTPQTIYNLKREELIKVKGIGDNCVNRILNAQIKRSLNEHIEYMVNNHIDLITMYDKEYPHILKQIYDFPVSLYVKGNKDILNKDSIAIIGCRQASIYGIKAAKYFSFNLANANINIVSGLAKGIDSYAHIGALSASGKTIAVIGNGLDSIYPKENFELSQMIVQNSGAIISEYPLGTKPEKLNFVARNRIISGLSKKIIVVEAKEKSRYIVDCRFRIRTRERCFCCSRKYKFYKFYWDKSFVEEWSKSSHNIFRCSLINIFITCSHFLNLLYPD